MSLPRRRLTTPMCLLLGALIGMGGCVVNPVPTPGTVSTTEGGNDQGGFAGEDAAASKDATMAASDATGGAGSPDATKADDALPPGDVTQTDLDATTVPDAVP